MFLLGEGGRHFCSRFYTIKLEGDRVAPLAPSGRLYCGVFCLLAIQIQSLSMDILTVNTCFVSICPVYYIRLLFTAWLSLSAHLAKKTKCFY